MSTTYVPADLRREVRARAKDCCEYCRIPESATFTAHQIDHIVAEKHGGETIADNLALSCVVCNIRKGSDIASIDPDTGQLSPLFHPRRDRWTDYFHLIDGGIEAITQVGQATTRVLQFNHPDRVAERILLLSCGVVSAPAELPNSG